MTQTPNWFAADLDAIPRRVLFELEAAKVAPGRPLIAVDADEVLVHFAEHFGEWIGARGYRFELTEYRLASALSGPGGEPLEPEEIRGLIWGFIDDETERQPMVAGAAAALASLARDAHVVVLTNAPSKVRAARIANLLGHGMDYPVVMNEGGKGRALRWLAARAEAPVFFVDDSAEQLGSAAKHAPDIARLHLVGSEMLKPIIGRAEAATAHPGDWREAEDLIRDVLRGG